MKVKLGELTKIKTGKLDANASSPDGEYPFFTCSKEPLKISTYSYDCECVLVAGNGDLNVKYYNGKFDAYQRTYIIEDNGLNKLYIPYLYYFLDRYVEELRKQSIGGVIKYIKLGNLTDALIELPILKEQKQIVEILDKSRSIIRIRKQQLEQLDLLIKARFVEMFEDIENTAIVGDYIASLTAGKSLASEEECKNKVLKTGAATYDFFDPTQVKNLPKNYKPIENHKLKDGDIIISRMNTAELVGAVAYVWKAPSNTYIPDRLWKAEIKSNCNPIFLWQMLIQPTTKEQIRRMASGTSGSMKNISKICLLKLKVKEVPIDLQNEFANFVAQVDKSKVVVQKALDEAQLLFDSLMQEYFG